MATRLSVVSVRECIIYVAQMISGYKHDRCIPPHTGMLRITFIIDMDNHVLSMATCSCGGPMSVYEESLTPDPGSLVDTT